MTPLPMTPAQFLTDCVNPGLALLPPRLDGTAPRMWLTTIAQQESGLAHRWQIVDPDDPAKKGPARGLLQFENGTWETRGGIWGVYLHPATRLLLKALCDRVNLSFVPYAIWDRLDKDDALAVAIGRLLLLTDPYALPEPDDDDGGWRMYADRLWKPGKPHRSTWNGYCEASRQALALADD